MEDNKFDNYGFAGRKYEVDQERRRKPHKVVPIVQHKVEVMVDRTIAPTIPRIYHENWIWRKAFWIICYIVCWTVFVYTTYQLWVKYITYGTNTDLSIVYHKELVFPSVTVCDMNSLSKTKARGAKELNDLTQADSAMWESVFSILKDSTDVDDFTIALKQPDCGSGQFKCNDGSCIDSHYVCDFYADCQNGEDERNKTCFISTTPGIVATGLTFADLVSDQQKSCPQTFGINYPYEDAIGDLHNLTHCCDWNDDRSLYTQVLPPWVVCDGYYHCADKSDEANCDSARSLAFCPKKNRVNVTSTEVVYVNQMSELCMRLVPSDIDCNRWCIDKCLRKSQLCDGVQDCPNGLDESICTSSSSDDGDNSNLIPSSSDRDDGDVNDYEYYIPENEDETGYIDEAFSSLTDTDDFATEADVYLSEELSLYKQLTLTARKDPYYSAVRAKLIPTEQSVKEYGIERESLIKLCTYNHHPCADNAGSFKYFWKTWRHTKYGKCYTFNHRETNFSLNQENKISSTGHTSGLHLTLSVNEEVYLPLMSPVVGAALGVSPSYQFPTPEMNTVILQPGVKHLLSLKKNQFKKLGTPYSQCVTKYPEFITSNSHYLSDNVQSFLGSYETNFCTQICQALHQILSCETGACRYGYLLSKSVAKAEGIPDCDLDKRDHFNCYSETKARVVNSSNCGCVQGCEQDYFSQFLSVGLFPSKAYVPFLLNSILSSDPDVLKFGEENKWAEEVVDALREVDNYMTEAVLENVTKILRRSLLDVHVFMDSLYVDTISEAPAYTIINLLADFGGNSGLYVGFCALSLFEIIEFFWDVGFALIKRKVCGIVSYYDEDDEEEGNGKKLSRASGSQSQPVAGTSDDTAL